MYEIKFSRDVFNFLKIRNKNFQKKMVNSFDILGKNPFNNFLDIKPLINKKGHFRLRIGNYRFLYEIRSKELLIYCYKAGPRGDIYKK